MSDRSNYEHSCPNHGPAFDCGVVQALRERIKELEKVAEEAAEIFQNYGDEMDMEFIDLEQFLLAAGYLGGEE